MFTLPFYHFFSGATGASCVYMIAVLSVSGDLCPAVSVLVCMAYMCLCGYLSGTDAEHHCCLDLKTRNCVSLISIGFPDLATPNHLYKFLVISYF